MKKNLKKYVSEIDCKKVHEKLNKEPYCVKILFESSTAERVYTDSQVNAICDSYFFLCSTIGVPYSVYLIVCTAFRNGLIAPCDMMRYTAASMDLITKKS